MFTAVRVTWPPPFHGNRVWVPIMSTELKLAILSAGGGAGVVPTFLFYVLLSRCKLAKKGKVSPGPIPDPQHTAQLAVFVLKSGFLAGAAAAVLPGCGGRVRGRRPPRHRLLLPPTHRDQGQGDERSQPILIQSSYPLQQRSTRKNHSVGRPPTPLPLREGNQVKEEITPLIPIGIGEPNQIKFRTCSALAPM
jgi:hypothetical protein